MAHPISIAIDGPAGAGKSTIARELASQLGYHYVDTGAIYRTAAYFFDLWGISPKDTDGIAKYIDELNVEISYDAEGVQHMLMNGIDVTDDIRTPDISQKASLVSAQPLVRELLLDMQRDMARKHDVVMDGRDIATSVLPDANVKIFLTASIEESARRRYKEMQEKGYDISLEELQKEIAARDKADSEREISPLVQAPDAELLDTSNMGIDEVVQAIIDRCSRV